MESIKKLYKIGNGPSSSHTMGPLKAAEIFASRHPHASRFEVTLYGSLAATGKGHLTDAAILKALTAVAPTSINWKPETVLPFHTNGMTFVAYDANGESSEPWTVYSVGGGDIVEEGQSRLPAANIYELSKIKDIQAYCEKTGKSYWEYVEDNEGPEIWDYLADIYDGPRAR